MAKIRPTEMKLATSISSKTKDFIVDLKWNIWMFLLTWNWTGQQMFMLSMVSILQPVCNHAFHNLCCLVRLNRYNSFSTFEHSTWTPGWTKTTAQRPFWRKWSWPGHKLEQFVGGSNMIWPRSDPTIYNYILYSQVRLSKMSEINRRLM